MADAVNINEDVVGIDRQEIQAAIAKAVELRAIHAALMQANTHSPAHLNFLSSPPISRPTPHLSTHDYPIFTPSHGDEPLPGYAHPQAASQMLSESWEESKLGDNHYDFVNQSLQLSDYTRPNVSSTNGLPPGLAKMNNHNCPADDSKSVASSWTNHMSFLQNSPGTELFKSRRRNSLGDFKSVSSCNNCKPATLSNMIVPLTDSHAGINPAQTKSRGMRFSWLFPRLKRRPKIDISSPIRTKFEEVSIEMLKKELIDANQRRDVALSEVSEMRSSFGELTKKLETLESYCEELKKALGKTVHSKSIPKRGRFSGDDLMPVSEAVMIEGFLQIVSEARLSVKQFCRTLFDQIDENDDQLTENLDQLLKPYKLSLSSRYSKAVIYHLEAMINQTLYQDFENCVFQKNGTIHNLDPQQDRLEKFQSFAGLRNLSWNEVLKKGTKYYSEEFSKFCDQKMSCVIMMLNWTRPWSEALLHSFFVAAKCIWLLHLLAFSFYPPLTILRVEENRTFDAHYMEDILSDKQKAQNISRVKVMVMPGFYVQDKILRCKVLCRYKSVA